MQTFSSSQDTQFQQKNFLDCYFHRIVFEKKQQKANAKKSIKEILDSVKNKKESQANISEIDKIAYNL